MNIKTVLLAIQDFLTPAPNVDAIVADLERTFGKLTAAEQKFAAKAEAAERKAAALVQKAVGHRVHGARARRVGARISDIIQ